MTSTIAQFIPIIFIFVLLSNYTGCILFSHTILGKLLAICVIVFYTAIDKTVGLFVCAIVIVFYQMDCVENVLNIENYGNIDGKYRSVAENFESYQESKDTKELMATDPTAQQQFLKTQCKDGSLTYKDLNVKNEMAEHVFPELKFNNKPCNVCSSGCSFSIIESKLRAEKELVIETQE